jgi:hypothetical protein
MPARLRALDNRVLGTPGEKNVAVSVGSALDGVLRVVLRVARLVFLVLALVLVVGVLFTLLPTNKSNTVVSNGLDLAKQVAGPFKDVFSPKSPKKAITANYGLAAVVYVVLAQICAKFGRGGK